VGIRPVVGNSPLNLDESPTGLGIVIIIWIKSPQAARGDSSKFSCRRLIQTVNQTAFRTRMSIFKSGISGSGCNWSHRLRIHPVVRTNPDY
jgi:hypothetical protein